MRICSLVHGAREILVDGVELLAALFYPMPERHLHPAQTVRLTPPLPSVESRA